MARLFAAHGVRKIRLTGGEPLLRKNIEILIEQLAALRTVDGEPLDLTLTTNGSLLTRKAQALKDAGLRRITVSLDGLDDAVFRSMNDVDFPVADVLAGIEAAKAAGLGPIDHLCQVTTIWSSDRYFGCIASNERPLPAIFADRLEQELSGKSLLIQGTSSLALESILSTPAQATRGQ